AKAAYCGIGSVKSNIGHLELAAGVAGLIKVLLQFKHKRLVSTLHCKEINSYIDLENTPFYILRESRDWNSLKDESGREIPRRAGVSSFGFGGANAHVVLEEYRVKRSETHSSMEIQTSDPVIIVLSARTKEQLEQRARDLFEFLHLSSLVGLQSLVYTFQVGREAMEERLGFIVTSIKELEEKLEAYLSDNQEIEDCYQGQVKRNRDTLAVFNADEELQEAIEKWIARKKLSKILALWVKGLSFDWNKLYGGIKPRRISLPTYPFVRERYWISAPQCYQLASTAGAAISMIHPLLHENTSDLSEQRFTSTFTGKEFFLNDHQVKGEKVLPGVGYLEMVRVAVEKASGEIEAGTAIYLKNVVWAQPIVFNGSAQQVHIGLFGEDNGQIQYEVYTESENEDGTIVHSLGVAEFKVKEEIPSLDIQNLQSQMNQGTLNAGGCYNAFKNVGLDYGAGYQGIREIYQGENQILAKLRLPSSVQDTQSEYVLHPSLMDSALQSSIGLMLKNSTLPDSSEAPPGIGRWPRGTNKSTLRPSLPFALESLKILAPCTSQMYAWVRYSGGGSAVLDRVQKLDIDMCDRQGNVCVKMQGLSFRTFEGEPGFQQKMGLEESQEETLVKEYQKRTLSHDLPLLQDHHVSGTPLLVGAAYLSMMIESGKKILNGKDFSIEKVFYSNPLSLDISETAEILLQGKILQNKIKFSAIYSKNNENQQTQAAEGILDLVSASLSGNESFDNYVKQSILIRKGSSFYLHPKQEVYGSSLFSVQEVYNINEIKVVGKIQLTETMIKELPDYVIHPSVFDACHVISTFSLTTKSDLLVENHHMPIMIEKVLVKGDFSKFQKSEYFCIAEKKLKNEKITRIDLQLFSMDGELLCLMEGFTTKKVIQNLFGQQFIINEVKDSIGTLLAIPVWKEVAIVSNVTQQEYTERQVLLCEMSEIKASELQALVPGSHCEGLESEQEQIESRFIEYAVSCFEMIRKLLEKKPRGNVLFQILVSKTREQLLFVGLSGLLKTAALENPKIIGQIIQVDPREMREDLVKKVEENKNAPYDAIIKYESGKRLVWTWEELKETEVKPDVAFKNKGVYLITGGVGGLGILFTSEILRQAKDVKIILTGRSKLSLQKQSELQELQSLGAEVDYRQVDVSNPEQVNLLIESIQDKYGKLNGIIHSAGVISDNFILKKPVEEFRKVLAPKVTGTINLDKATRGIALDFFVLFSSGAGARGNIGQADYATANAFMDRFAAYRNRLVDSKESKGQTLSINWPLWKGGGMGVDTASEAIMKQSTGMKAMKTETGIQAFYQSLNSHHSQVVVMEGLVSKMRKTLISQSSLQKNSPVSQTATGSGIDTRSLLAKIQRMLIQEVSTAIKLDPQKIQLDVDFDKYGFDSIVLMDFARQLNKKYQLELMPTIFFEYSTIGTFAEYLVREHESVFVKYFRVEMRSQTSGETIESKEDPVTGIIKRRSGFVRIKPVVNSVSEIKPIAIIGMNGLFAESHNIERFWGNIESRKNLIKEVPFDHWDYRPWYDSNPEAKDKTYCKWGSFIEGVDQFDASFFNISRREAEWMDPQLRLLLQSIYKSSEVAGLINQIRGSNTGVFVGICFHDYGDKIAELNLPVDPYMGTGNSQTVIANRVSFIFDLTGPSVSVDTACSSSLFALHQACQAIRNQECRMAFVGGVNLLLSSWHYRYFSSIGALSPTGRCHTFDAKADGYVPGEAIASILLKPLDQAVKDEDTIYAIVRGSAALHGGSTPSLTAPSASGERNVITSAWKDADIDPSTLSYIEAHGT
ncbi:MAG: SDR family NAD(P)-dependent oxidoreductase, partial [Planctomycetes bacterium]|nr:SDR family NAD(P)-dependent oxidoreductase [Planctomycetota bacterium]